MIKKIKMMFSFLMALVLLTSSLIFPASATEEKIFNLTMLGDVDGDGEVTAADARIALRISSRLVPNPTIYQLLAADFDEDGFVAASDARSILRLSSRLIPHPYPELPDPKEGFAEILKEYSDIMNKAKRNDKPGFTRINYSTEPADGKIFTITIDGEDATEDLKNLIKIFSGGEFELDDLFDQIFDEIMKGDMLFISREEALKTAITISKNSNMLKFPLFDLEYGCLLNDIKNVNKAVCETQGDNKKIIICLDEEINPKPGNASPVGSMFLPIPMLGDFDEFPEPEPDDIIFLKSAYLLYRDCTATLEYNPQTGHIKSLKQEMTISIVLVMDFLGEEMEMAFSSTHILELFNFNY